MIELLLDELNINYKKFREELITDCILCLKENHFYINNNTGLWECKRCGEKGNKQKLMELFNIKEKEENPSNFTFINNSVYINNLWDINNKIGINYLKNNRKLTEEIIHKFKLGLYNNCITIPYIETEEIKGIKKRNLYENNGKRYTYELGSTLILYGKEFIDENLDFIILTEGEFNVMAAHVYGFYNIVGIPGAATLKEEWLNYLNKFKRIYIVTDNDGPGEKASQKVVSFCDKFKCRRVVLPYKDINDCLIQHVDNIIEYFKNALIIDEVGGNVTPKEGYKEIRELLLNPDKLKGVSTGFSQLDKNLGGIRGGEITLITANTGIGKTTFSVNLAYNLLKQNKKVLFGSFEMAPITEIMPKFYSIHTQKNAFLGLFNEDDFIFCETFFNSDNLIFINKSGPTPLDELKLIIEYWYDRGIEFVFLDHLHYIVLEETYDMLSKAIKEIKTWVLKMPKLHIFLVVHPKALQRNQEGEFPDISIEDIKGTSAIKQIASNVLVLNRPSLYSTKVSLSKVRSPIGSPGADIFFKFNHNSLTYYE